MISGVIAHFSRYAARFQLESICFLAQNTGGLPPWLIRGPNHIVKVNFNKPDVSDGRRPSAGCIAAAQLWNQACPGRVDKPSMRSLTLLILAAAAGWSAEDANGIIKRLAAAQTGNDSLAGEYTYVQEAAFRSDLSLCSFWPPPPVGPRKTRTGLSNGWPQPKQGTIPWPGNTPTCKRPLSSRTDRKSTRPELQSL